MSVCLTGISAGRGHPPHLGFFGLPLRRRHVVAELDEARTAYKPFRFLDGHLSPRLFQKFGCQASSANGAMFIENLGDDFLSVDVKSNAHATFGPFRRQLIPPSPTLVGPVVPLRLD